MSVENLYTPDCIRTFTGKYFNPCEPDLKLVCIEDIAHALAMQPRFGGRPKAVKVNKERYFFVGYSVNNGKQTATGNVQWFTHDGLLPIKKEIFNFLKKDMQGFAFSFDQLVIVGLYEFKNESECTFFFNCQKIKR